MAQEVCSINCPGCGAIIEVVSPVMDAKVESLDVDLAADFDSFCDNCTKTVCPKCKARLGIAWWYK